MKHELKIYEQFAQAILDGDKTFEIRNNDRDFQKYDRIMFIPIDNLKLPSFKISPFEATITYVLSGWGIQEGYVALGIRVVQNANEADMRKEAKQNDID